jgi:hypothetical protein
MFKNISIIGDGGMGTVLAILLCEKKTAYSGQRSVDRKRKINAIWNTQSEIRVRMWGYDREQLAEIARNRENKKFLPGYKLPEALVFEPDDRRIMDEAELIVSAVPCQYIRRVWNRLKDYVPQGVAIVSVTKGIENDTLLRPTQILADVLGEKRETRDEGRGTRDEGRGTGDEGREMRDERRGTRDERRGTRDEWRLTRDECRGTRDEGRETRDEGRGTRDEGRETRDEGRGTRDEGRGTMDEGRGTRDEGRGTRDEGRGTRDEGRGTRDEGQDLPYSAGRLSPMSWPGDFQRRPA